uniref:Uncharacterized protein n=1 Tax=Onchocerca volvulus TaxID=6282 RepID=A0A2K6W426_ONCVO
MWVVLSQIHEAEDLRMDEIECSMKSDYLHLVQNIDFGNSPVQIHKHIQKDVVIFTLICPHVFVTSTTSQIAT